MIVATGARANYLGLPSEDKFKNRGVSACAVCDGALPRFRNKPLVVVGGGDSAVEEATYLTKFAVEVHMVHRRDKLRRQQIMQERALDNPKIKILWNRDTRRSPGQRQRRRHRRPAEKHRRRSANCELPATGVFLAIGHTPNTAFLKGQVESMTERIYPLDQTPPHLHQRGRRVRRRRRRRRLLPPGDHRRRHRLHGRPRRRTLAGGTGDSLKFCVRRWRQIWYVTVLQRFREESRTASANL